MRGRSLTSEVKVRAPHLGYLRVMPAVETEVGALLKQYRVARRLSQEALADAAEVSTRHLSYVENGKSKPSREMVLVLSSALDIPLRERNRLLHAAGFAPAYDTYDIEGPELAHIRKALDHMLTHHEPFPCVVFDRSWRVLYANRGANRCFGTVLGLPAGFSLVGMDAMELIFSPDLPLRATLVDFEGFAKEMVERLVRDAERDPSETGPRGVLERVLRHPGVADAVRAARQSMKAPVVATPLHIKRGDVEVRFFTTITTLGTAHDVTAEALKIETYFPLDDATDAFVRSLSLPD